MTKAVDLFAGWGGFTEGAEQAGIEVVYAANHWPLAVQAHAQNHPEARHVCQDLRQADWRDLPAYDLLLAAPACQGHSQAAQPGRKANGGVRGAHDALRATAWAVVDCAEVTTPEALIVENVPDFLRWKLYPRWKACLADLGYHVTEHRLTASYFGAPQRRDRLFVVGTRDGRAVELTPSATETPFGPCIDWDAPAKWRKVSESTPAVKRRVARSRDRGHGRRFITQHVTGHAGIALDQPIRTVTTKDQWAIVDGDLYRPLTIRENARAMGFPEHYSWPEGARRGDAIKGLGNAVCPPVAKALVEAVAA